MSVTATAATDNLSLSKMEDALSESTPLLGTKEDAVEVVSTSSKFPSLTAISLVVLLGLTAVVVYMASPFEFGSVRNHVTAFQAASSAATTGTTDKPCDVTASGVSFCPSTLPDNIENVHLKPGCIMMSTNDLASMKLNGAMASKYANSPILTVCASMASGVVMVGNNILAKYGMVSGSKSAVSSILYSDDIQMKIFSGKNFDGGVIGAYGTPYNDPYTRLIGFSGLKYNDGGHVNDNVNSFLFATSSIEMSSCLNAMEFTTTATKK
jgi:hypothetical protein